MAFQALADLKSAGIEIWLSRQVLREYLATLTRTQIYAAPQPPVVLTAQIRQFEVLMKIAEDTAVVTARLLDLLTTIPVGGKQIHDANIVATMQANGISRLLTHNTADFARFAGLISIEPLVP